MFFSILVPVYNTEKYLETCIDSILNQTEKDYELILLDDGSTDSSPQICDRYAGLYPDTIKVRHRENKGLLLTRREQLKMASGDYIVFVDSDDYLRKDALEVLRSTIEEYNADMVMYKYNLTNDNNEISTTAPAFENGRVFTQDTKKELYSAILSTNTLNNLCTKAVKYTLFDLENSYEQASMVTSGEDLLQSLPLITSAQRVVYIDQGLYYYRRNPESMTRSVTVKSYEQSSLVGKALLEYMKIWGMANDFYMQMFYARRIKSLI
ncbi:MAG TPA: glycosyltransferase family 2 protein, partial [Candidatus Atribacteria bacterium]|nr:glycosyltransferase family 2 protein [Candidatus Atribacteria bacterium]